jgi:hypothetical protein
MATHGASIAPPKRRPKRLNSRLRPLHSAMGDIALPVPAIWRWRYHGRFDWDRVARFRGTRREIQHVTVCVAAISSDGPCIICVADKALSYGDYIQWDSDCVKIVPLQHWKAACMMSSDNEAHATKLLRALDDTDIDYAGDRIQLAAALEPDHES